MRQDDTFEDGLTSEELAALSSLTAERVPPARLKARTVRALADAGRLRPMQRVTPRLMLVFSAAASVVFIAGAALGYAAALRHLQRTPSEAATSVPSRAVARVEPSDSTAVLRRQVVWF
jgi:hypothetical protein